MQTYLLIILSIVIMAVWFKAVLFVGKHTIGKDAKLRDILTFLLLAGPIGWAVIVILLVYELVDIIYKKFQKHY